MGRLRGAQNIFARAGARINEAGRAQLFKCLPVEMRAPGLSIRRKRPPVIRSFLPLESEPAKVLEHRQREFRLAAIRIQILISQNERAAALLGASLGRPKCAGVPEVQKPRGRRRQPSAIIGCASFAQSPVVYPFAPAVQKFLLCSPTMRCRTSGAWTGK